MIDSRSGESRCAGMASVRVDASGWFFAADDKKWHLGAVRSTAVNGEGLERPQELPVMWRDCQPDSGCLEWHGPFDVPQAEFGHVCPMCAIASRGDARWWTADGGKLPEFAHYQGDPQ